LALGRNKMPLIAIKIKKIKEVNKAKNDIINRIIAVLYHVEGLSWEEYTEMKDFLNNIRINKEK
tara:strand:- start:34 stop:225 length:192 start_codon:yes stop_codon:yes gene_type:complete